MPDSRLITTATTLSPDRRLKPATAIGIMIAISIVAIACGRGNAAPNTPVHVADIAGPSASFINQDGLNSAFESLLQLDSFTVAGDFMSPSLRRTYVPLIHQSSSADPITIVGGPVTASGKFVTPNEFHLLLTPGIDSITTAEGTTAVLAEPEEAITVRNGLHVNAGIPVNTYPAEPDSLLSEFLSTAISGHPNTSGIADFLSFDSLQRLPPDPFDDSRVIGFEAERHRAQSTETWRFWLDAIDGLPFRIEFVVDDPTREALGPVVRGRLLLSDFVHPGSRTTTG